VVHKGHGSQHVFKPSKKVLYYLDMTNNIGATLVTTVDESAKWTKVNRYTWMELPMPNEVIKQAHRLARVAENMKA